MKSLGSWEEQSPNLHVFTADGYVGGFERSGKLVHLFLRRPGQDANILAGTAYGEGSALNDGEWERGIPKFKARVEDAYRAEVGLPSL